MQTQDIANLEAQLLFSNIPFEPLSYGSIESDNVALLANLSGGGRQLQMRSLRRGVIPRVERARNLCKKSSFNLPQARIICPHPLCSCRKLGFRALADVLREYLLYPDSDSGCEAIRASQNLTNNTLSRPSNSAAGGPTRKTLRLA